MTNTGARPSPPTWPVLWSASALDRRPGTFHVTNQGETTWFGFAQATLAAAGLDPDRVEAIGTSDLDPPRPAPRPAN